MPLVRDVEKWKELHSQAEAEIDRRRKALNDGESCCTLPCGALDGTALIANHRHFADCAHVLRVCALFVAQHTRAGAGVVWRC